jgi:hypothetical protein
VTEAIFLTRARGNEGGGVTPVFPGASVKMSAFRMLQILDRSPKQFL